MVFSPEFCWLVLDVVPWWYWVLEALALLVVAGVAELLHARAARREATSSGVVEARPAGRMTGRCRGHELVGGGRLVGGVQRRSARGPVG